MPDIEINLPGVTYRIGDLDLSSSDRLNGITYRGFIAVSIPYRDSSSPDWSESNAGYAWPHDIIEQNGIMEIDDFGSIQGVRNGAHCKTAKASFY